MMAEVLDTFGPLDIVVSSASASHFQVGAFEDHDWEQFSQGVDSRLRPAFLVTQAVLPSMRQQGRGRLVYAGSENSEGPAAPA
jgi:3-oxoacyl-[acyl-carrier protein] reductase